MATPVRISVICGTAVVGLAAEWVAYDWHEPSQWLPDLLVGWVFLAAGSVAAARATESRIGALLVATGVAWFAGNFASAEWAPVAWLATHAAYLHRGLLLHCIVSFPSGRLSSWPMRAAVAAGYAVSLAPVARSDVMTMIFGAALLAGGLWRRASAAAAALTLGGALLGVAALRLALPAADADDAALLAYETALCLVALELAAGVVQRAGVRRDLPNLVVELGESRSGSLRDALARALGDPTLEVGYFLSAGRVADGAGRELALPALGSERAMTVIERGQRPVAAIVHDRAVLDDPMLIGAVSAGAELAASNARLQAEVCGQLGELHASRRRLLDAGDEERRRLERQLHDGVERALAALSDTLEGTRAQAACGAWAPDALEEIGRAQEQLARSREELGELGRGLHPRALSELGLAGALTQLAAESEVDVEVVAPKLGLPLAAEVTSYFACVEALANVIKYASATHARIEVRHADRRLTVRIRDDGVGGANAANGTGLRGLADRVEAHGGRLKIESPRGRGTLLEVTIPTERR